MENAQEASFLEGKFIRHLFTGRLHTKSRLWLSIMGLVGVALTMPLAVYAISFMEPAPPIRMPANGGLSMSVEDILAVFDSCGIDGDALKTAGSSDFGGKPSVHRHCERFLRSNLLSTGTEIASSRTALLAMTHVGDNNPAEPGRAKRL
jgi:hypothetical protein